MEEPPEVGDRLRDTDEHVKKETIDRKANERVDIDFEGDDDSAEYSSEGVDEEDDNEDYGVVLRTGREVSPPKSTAGKYKSEHKMTSLPHKSRTTALSH
jgi:hypothetical protein